MHSNYKDEEGVFRRGVSVAMSVLLHQEVVLEMEGGGGAVRTRL